LVEGTTTDLSQVTDKLCLPTEVLSTVAQAIRKLR
jgi:hypothetical protein